MLMLAVSEAKTPEELEDRAREFALLMTETYQSSRPLPPSVSRLFVTLLTPLLTMHLSNKPEVKLSTELTETIEALLNSLEKDLAEQAS